MSYRTVLSGAFKTLVLIAFTLCPSAARADAGSEYDRLEDLFLEQHAAGHYDLAKKTAAAMRRLAEGPLRRDREKLLWAVNRQGWVAGSQRRFADAERLYLWALDVAKRIDGSKSESAAILLNNLGMLYQNQGRYSKAETLFNRSLEIHRARGHASRRSGNRPGATDGQPASDDP